MPKLGLGALATAYVDALTEHWLGWTFPPVERAIEESNWKPDSPDAYCQRCGDSIGLFESTASGCATCRTGGEMAGGIAQGVIRLGPHAQSLRQWALAIKFQGWSEMGDYLGRELGRRVLESKGINPDRCVIVPMPMPWQRRFYRGIDHARVIAQGVAKELSAPVISLLARRNLPPQVTLAPSMRRRHGGRGLQLRRRLIPFSDGVLRGCHLVLVDDVRTTGASLKAAARLLRTLKPERIVCAVLAVSDAKARRQRKSPSVHALQEGVQSAT